MTIRHKTLRLLLAAACVATAGLMQGCAHTAPNTSYREHIPRSILVLPPLNDTNEVIAGYSYLSAMTGPLAEHGYYVFPVAVVDNFMKENGMPTAGEMHQIPPAELGRVFGADAVLYITVTEYDSSVISNSSTVAATARLVETAGGTQLWEGKHSHSRDLSRSSKNSGLIGALASRAIAKAVSNATDGNYATAREGAWRFYPNTQVGLMRGPRSPQFEGKAVGPSTATTDAPKEAGESKD